MKYHLVRLSLALLLFFSCQKVGREPLPDPLPGADSIIVPPAQTLALGAHVHEWNVGDQLPTVLDQLAAAGISCIRVDVGWRTMEEDCEGCYTTYYAHKIDAVVAAAEARNIAVLLVVQHTPAWANADGDKYAPPADTNKFGNFMHWLAARYKGRVMAYEIWNEPNSSDFFHGTPAQYTQMLKAAYPAIKLGDAAAKVVFGGPSYQDAPFIAACYAAGAQPYFDIMATHPYQGKSDEPPEKPSDGHIWWLTEQVTLQQVMAAYEDAEKEVWWTEFGWSAHSNTPDLPPYALGVSQEVQGHFLVSTLKFARANYPKVSRAFWYNAMDREDGGLQNMNYGLIRRHLTHKPALDSIKVYFGK